MAVYTIVDTQELDALLKRYDIGELTSCKGIAEGVENSNYFIETNHNKYILTLFENRVNKDDLPFFFDLLDHLKKSGCPVPRFIADKEGIILQNVANKPACIIEFLSGVSIAKPTVDIAKSMGSILADMHIALKNYQGSRTNNMALSDWHHMADSCKEKDIQQIDSRLYKSIYDELSYLDKHWPHHLPQSVIHGDLFPDNILLRDSAITGVIDFYFAATDIRDYDIAVTHAAWCFNSKDQMFDAAISDALLKTYDAKLPLNDESIKHFSTLLRGAALRFTLSRTVDWINTPADALVTKKNPLTFLQILEFYQDDTNINHILNFKG